MLTPRTPETNKTPGVRYAVTLDGVELPVIDVTHPAFASTPTAVEQRTAVERFLREGRGLTKMPPFLRKWMLRLFLRNSLIGRGIQSAEGTFLDGMTTYLLKLGPDNLGRAYTKPADRRIAAAVPALTMRWRLEDMARLLADAIGAVPPGTQPIHLLDIAGGPAMDSLNALIVVNRQLAGVLAGRRISITVLDGASDGPAFGARALRALSAEGAPLAGLDISFRQVGYDWRRVEVMKTVLDEARADGAWMVGSSEGGLFEYGSDDEIVDNLKTLRDAAPSGFVMVGSVTRNDEPVQILKQMGGPAIRPRGLAVFRKLAEGAGWRVARVIERPFGDNVALRRLSEA